MAFTVWAKPCAQESHAHVRCTTTLLLQAAALCASAGHPKRVKGAGLKVLP